MSDFIGVFG